MKIGIVFAGQGAQYPGMGKDLYDNFLGARRILDEAGEEIKSWCFEGTKEMLRQTHITQPSIYAVTMAAYEAFLEKMKEEELLQKVELIGFSGFSLGEYAALTAAGSLKDFKKGLEIVTKRGELMEKAGLDEEGNPKGGMVAAFGKREKILEVVERVRRGRILSGVNFNSPIQTVVAGEREALEDFIEEAKKERIKAKMLSVSTAFHCKMMSPAVEELRELLLNADLRAPEKKIYSNVTADDMMKGLTEYAEKRGKSEKESAGEYVAGLMAKQVESPVYWQEIIEKMAEDGMEVLVEIGPGKTLSGLTKKINRHVLPLHVEDKESLEETIEELKEEINA